MKVLLVQPPFNPNIIGAGIVYCSEPLGLESIAGNIPHREVKILDMRIEPDFDKELVSFQPDIVAITSLTTDVYIARNLLRKVKDYNPEILTVVGGHHATIMPKDFNEDFIDVIVIGEGEITFRELVDTYEVKGNFKDVSGIALPDGEELMFTPRRKLTSDLDKIPFPDRGLTKKYRHKYFRGTWKPITSVMTSRGCPFRCNFCAMWKVMNGKYWVRSPQSVVNEISEVEGKYIDFVDDNTLHDVKRAERIYEMIKERGIKKIFKLFARSDTIVKKAHIIAKWKEIGLQLVLIGLESYKDDELTSLNKHNTVRNNEEAIHILHDSDIEVVASFIIHPTYEEEDFNALAEYVDKMNLIHPIFTVLTPFPGTDLYKETYDKLLTHNYELFDAVHSLLPTKLPRKKFYQCFVDLCRRTYSSERSKGKSPFPREKMEKIYLRLSEAHKL